MDGTAPGTGTIAGQGASVSFGADGKPLEESPGMGTPTPPAPEETPPGEGGDGAPPEEGDTPPAPTPEGALPEWDPEKPEVVSAYEQRYFNPEGKLDLAAVTKEFWANAKDGKNGTLNEGTYAYLEQALGVSKEAAKAIEAGLVAQQAQEQSRFWQKVGGRQRYAAALEWGKATYSDADKARFNAAIQGLDTGARDDAVDALLARYDRANPRAARRGPPRRPASPARSVTSQAEGAATAPASQVPYADQEAYTKAFQAAINAERDAKSPADRRKAQETRAKVQADGRVSMRHWKK